MRHEVEPGGPSGRLFADRLSLAMLASIRARYSAAEPVPARRARLSKAQMRILGEHVEADLGGDLGVAAARQRCRTGQNRLCNRLDLAMAMARAKIVGN
jgi:hypothetical protein